MATIKEQIPAEVGAAAEWYANNLGWRVFPLHSVVNGVCTCNKGAACGAQAGKHPRVSIPSGEGAIHPATKDIKQIKAWWKKWPNANIGFWMDESDLLVLDIDKGDKKDGFQALAEIMAFEGQDTFPATLTCETPSGGLHHYFTFTDGVPNKANSLSPGLDTWHTLHYVILPPSNHLKGVYAWRDNCDSIAEYPDWLKPKSKEAQNKQRTGAKVKAMGRPTKERIDPTDPDDIARLTHALKHVDNTDREKWVLIAFALARAFDWSDAGFKLYDDWAKGAHNYDQKKTSEQYYKQSKVVASTPITCATIFEWARLHPDYQAWQKIDDRPFEIREYPSDHPTTLMEIAGIIGEYPIYQRGPKLVEIIPINKDTPLDGNWFPKGSYILREMEANQFASRLLPVQARWMRKGVQGWKSGVAHIGLCETFLGIGNWPTAKKLRAFVQHPTLRDDGSLLATRGYDAKSALFLTEEIKVQVKDKPSKGDAQKAMKYLMTPFSEFKWIDGDVSAAAMMAGLFTVGLRHLFDEAVPLFAVDAPRQGSGKTKIVKAISNLWFGRPMAVTPYSTEPEEMKKHLASMLLNGDRVVLFDNVPPTVKVNDPTLNALLTSGRATFRELGTQRMLELDSAATFFMTGNNLKIVGDMIRRTIRLQIDPEGLHPMDRSFKIDPLEGWVLDHRAQMLSAALTVAKAFFVAGKPKQRGVKSIASFELWSDTIRNMLLWVGMEDVRETVSQGYDQDDESMEIEHLLGELDKIPELLGEGLTSGAMMPLIENNKALKEAMLPFLGERAYTGINHPRVVTTILSSVAKIMVSGRKLMRFGPFWVIRAKD